MEEDCRLHFVQIYSSMIQHSDFHAKNVSILETTKKNYILAPLYDVISVGVYNGKSNDLGLPLSLKYRKYGKYNIDDYMQISKAVGIGKSLSMDVLKDTIEVFLDKFPLYIEKTKIFEEKHNLKIQNTRYSKKSFSSQLTSIYNNKIIQLKKQGVLETLSLIEKYGGKLKRQKSDLHRLNRHKWD